MNLTSARHGLRRLWAQDTFVYSLRVTLALGSVIAIGIFIVAQLLVEHVFNYKTTVGILVNLVCGGYFLVLMVRTRGAP